VIDDLIEPAPSELLRARSRERYRRAGLTAGAAVVARGIATLSALIAAPLAIPYLGSERYGLWVTITSLAVVLAFMDFGIGNSLLTSIARSDGLQDRRLLNTTVATGTLLLGAIGLALIPITLAGYAFVDWASVFNVQDPVAREEVAPAVLAFGLCFAISLPLTAIANVRYGLQQAYVNSAFIAVGNIVGLGLLVGAILLHLGLPWLVIAFMSAPLLAGVANGTALLRERPQLAPTPDRYDPTVASALARSGLQFFILQLAMSVAFYADTLIAASVLGPVAAAEYAVAMLLFLVPAGAAAAALSPLWPAYAEASARGDHHWVRATLGRSVLVAIALTAPLSLLIYALNPQIQEFWIGGTVTAPALLVLGMAAWTVLRAIGQAVAMFLNGLHLLKVQVITAVLMAPLNLVLSVWLATRIGVEGVILGTLIAYPIATLIPIGFYLRTTLRRIAAQSASGSRE
jgi:O-antigen/teichoic acid export membrane protein